MLGSDAVCERRPRGAQSGARTRQVVGNSQIMHPSVVIPASIMNAECASAGGRIHHASGAHSRANTDKMVTTL